VADLANNPWYSGRILRFRLAAPGGWESGKDARVTVKLAGVDVPTQKYVKEIIRVGSYVKLSDGVAFKIGMSALANWVMQFTRMKENGIKVPIPATHKSPEWEDEARKGDPRDNMGWVDGMFVKGDRLYMSCTLIGDDAIKAARRGDVSINSPPMFVDGKGAVYERPITHVALCTDPVVPGLGAFVPLAASRSKTIRLQGESAMLDFLKKLGAMLGLDPEAMIDDATAQAMLEEALSAVIEKLNATADGNADGSTAPTNPTPTASTSSGSTSSGTVMKETLTRQYAPKFSREDDGFKVPPMIVRQLSQARTVQIDQLLKDRKITAALAKDLKQRYVGDDGKVIELALSRDDDGGEFEFMLKTLESNQPIGAGPKSGVQTLSLSDPRKGGDEKSPLVQDAENRAKAAAKRAG
jgi:hypothetical protein